MIILTVVCWLAVLFAFVISPDIAHVLGFPHQKESCPVPTLSDMISQRYVDGTITLDGIDRFLEYLDKSGDLDALDEAASTASYYWRAYCDPSPQPAVTVAVANRRIKAAAERASAATFTPSGFAGTASIPFSSAVLPPNHIINAPHLEVVEIVGANGNSLAHVPRRMSPGEAERLREVFTRRIR